MLKKLNVYIEKLILLAKSQLGTVEDPPESNNIIYNTVYYGKPVKGSWYPWCVVFLWWLFHTCELDQLFFGGQRTASCTTLRNFYKQRNQWSTDGNYLPGDIAIMTFNKSRSIQHCGLIIKNNGNGYYTIIEGNTSPGIEGSQFNGGCVALKVRHISNIIGACRPKYEEVEEEMTDEKFAEFMNRYLQNQADQPLPNWAKEELQEAVDAGITDGTRPMQLIPRYQAAIMALRAMRGQKK